MAGDESLTEDDRKALANYAWIMAADDRREVEDTAVHCWRIERAEWTNAIIDRWLPEELREEWEALRRGEEA
jgi:hypothetical protein